MNPRIAATALALAALALSGCVTLTPFEQVRLAAGAERYLEIDGHAVHVEQAGAGPAVLLVHGFGGSTYSWRHVVPDLARDHRVVTLDLNGFGWSERPRERGAYTIEGQERLVLGVADALGLERFALVGHSYGGGLSLWIASRHPRRLTSLTLVDSTLPSYSTERRSALASARPVVSLFLRTAMLREWTVRRALRRSMYDDSAVTGELVREYLRRVRVEGVIEAYQGLTAPVDGPEPTVDLEALAVPTLVVWGADDELLAAELGAKAAARMPGARFVTLERCGHAPMEERPAEFLVALRAHLAAYPGER
ncbi:MAG: alpha/beta fold hydrolase [Acidobacteriota bacterium]